MILQSLRNRRHFDLRNPLSSQKAIGNSPSKNEEAELSNEMEIDKSNAEVQSIEKGSDAAKNTSNKSLNEKIEKAKATNKKIRTLVPTLQMAGHTGYLTFATWPRQAQVTQPNTRSIEENLQAPEPSTVNTE